LYGIISPNDKNKRLKAIICLPSAIIYTQNYNIPNVGEDRIEEAANLNLEMISPIPTKDAYMSWQIVNETEDKIELLGAFAEKSVVDKFRNLLMEANFMPMIFEFPSLSLSWTINDSIGPREESFLVLSVSGDGIDIFLLKNGSIYFDYYKSWKSVQGNKKKISREDFDNVLVEEVRKVASFMSSRFNSDLKYVFIVASGLSSEIKSVLETNFNVQAAPLQTSFKSFSSTWFPVLGSALRGAWKRSEDHFINLGIYRVEDIFFKEQMFSFISLWRNILIGIMSIFICLMSFSFFLLKTQPETLENRLEIFNVDFNKTDEEKLISSVNEFNNILLAVKNVKNDDVNVLDILDQIDNIAKEYDVITNKIDISLDNKRIDMTGKVPSYDNVIGFKNSLIKSPLFYDVNMPFSSIIKSEGNYVDFNVSFIYQKLKNTN
jgi:hypothetical protein